MMMGLHFMGEAPFHEVYIHALVRDPEGQKMSKSKGNVIDPLELMQHYGTDAFRFSLAAFAAMGRDIRLSEERISGYRNFANKVWNACRFTLMNLEDYDPAAATPDLPLTVVDAWIMSRLQEVSRETASRLGAYEFDQAANVLYQFIWHEFCDWYLELIKPRLHDQEDAPGRRHCQEVLLRVLSAILRLLHPFMPFITEEIWQKLPGASGSIMTAPYPLMEVGLVNPQAEAEMGLVMEAITAIRNLRGEMNVPPASKVEVFLRSADPWSLAALEGHRQAVMLLARVKELHHNADAIPAAAAKAVVDRVEIFMPLTGVIDFKEEERRLAKEMEKISKELAQAQRKMANEDFLAKAPPEVVNKEKERLNSWSEKLAKLKAHQERIKALLG
jgi:valyl-tRNA synthetase